jgi:hypothetical protein
MTLGNFLCILYNFCCTPGTYTVELPEYNHNSDLNMQVLRIKDNIYMYIYIYIYTVEPLITDSAGEFKFCPL